MMNLLALHQCFSSAAQYSRRNWSPLAAPSTSSYGCCPLPAFQSTYWVRRCCSQLWVCFVYEDDPQHLNQCYPCMLFCYHYLKTGLNRALRYLAFGPYRIRHSSDWRTVWVFCGFIARSFWSPGCACGWLVFADRASFAISFVAKLGAWWLTRLFKVRTIVARGRCQAECGVGYGFASAFT